MRTTSMACWMREAQSPFPRIMGRALQCLID